ncbi:hypothetical protein HYPSUDRAFT_201711 [Hypholoma sublateritium FD-334 SS-4]|uniref:Uncharacterized protein n=1 Tax=Hypholoma sublateritium (strain FD-334 SS-4) TaxID=945553 RepID=A0A0D2NVL1_HYPSF|nr:hypothetical protein HYPSUDRAFT_201711 [Hypholoma sublateritium FD-334 SS-4]
MDRLSASSASTSTALVVRAPMVVEPARAVDLRLPPDLPVLKFVGVESRILAITNLPDFFVWVDVLGWLRSGLNRAGRSSILRVLRTVEPGGRQVFWLKMATVRDAAVLRGVMGGRVVADSPELRVHFVHHDLYSARASVFYDAWSPRHGMEIGNRPGYRASLFDRLALPDPGSRPASLPAPEDPGHRFLHEAPEPAPQPVTDEDRRRRRARRR